MQNTMVIPIYNIKCSPRSMACLSDQVLSAALAAGLTLGLATLEPFGLQARNTVILRIPILGNLHVSTHVYKVVGGW